MPCSVRYNNIGWNTCDLDGRRRPTDAPLIGLVGVASTYLDTTWTYPHSRTAGGHSWYYTD